MAVSFLYPRSLLGLLRRAQFRGGLVNPTGFGCGRGVCIRFSLFRPRLHFDNSLGPKRLTHFPRQNSISFKKASKDDFSPHQSIDNSFLSYHKKFSPILDEKWRRRSKLWPKKRMHICGIIAILRAILAYNLAKCQYAIFFNETWFIR